MGDAEYRVIASGTVRDGVRWTMEAGGTDDEYWTGMLVVGPGHCTNNGGMAGPKLWGTDLLNTFTARYDDGPPDLVIAVRADRSVRRVLLTTADGVESSLTACGEGVIDGLRFFVGFAKPQTVRPRRTFGLRDLRGLDADGSTLETYGLSFWDRPAFD